MQKLSRRVREHNIEHLALLSDSDECDELKLMDVEKMKKSVKGKRCVLDQDANIVQQIVNAMDEENVVAKTEK